MKNFRQLVAASVLTWVVCCLADPLNGGQRD